MVDAGTIHLQKRDARRVAADRGPDGQTLEMLGQRYVLDCGAERGEALRGIAHVRVDVRLGIRLTEALFDHADAQAFDARFKPIGVFASRYAALA